MNQKVIMKDLNVAVVCSSNMNRSMEAHAFLAKKGFNVKSYGTGDRVRLPGSSAEFPNCYDFGVSYDAIYNDLVVKDKEYYTKIGLLSMLDRNRRTKWCPEKFQRCDELFDVIVTCEERVYAQVLDWFYSRRLVHNKPVHVVNIDIQDNHEDAIIGAFVICDLIMKMAQSNDLENEIDIMIQEIEEKHKTNMLSCIMFY